jgi:hypothetical protein
MSSGSCVQLLFGFTRRHRGREVCRLSNSNAGTVRSEAKSCSASDAAACITCSQLSRMMRSFLERMRSRSSRLASFAFNSSPADVAMAEQQDPDRQGFPGRRSRFLRRTPRQGRGRQRSQSRAAGSPCTNFKATVSRRIESPRKRPSPTDHARTVNKEIARHLDIGPETAKSHLKSVFAKLGVERRSQAVSRSQTLGLVITE